MKKCLLVIDYQYGLVSKSVDMRAIEGYIYSRVRSFSEEGEVVLFTLTDSESTKKGSMGYEVFGSLNKYAGGRLANENAGVIEKNTYMPSMEILEKLVNSFDEIELLGIQTDISVLQTAVGLCAAKAHNNSQAYLVLNDRGCASLDMDKHLEAVEYIRDILMFD